MAYFQDFRQMMLTKLKEDADFRKLAEKHQLSITTTETV